MLWIILSGCVAETLGLHSKTLSKWPDSIVYFDIDPFLPKEMRETVRYAVQYMNLNTCVQWKQRYPWANVSNYVTFNYYRNDTWAKSQCRSNVGMIGGQQELRLGRNCWRQRYGRQDWQRRTVLHEMTHVVGLKHEFQRPDRDCYVAITDSAKVQRYAKLPNPSAWVDDFPYDYISILHYVKYMGIETLNKSITELGRNDGTLSPTDIKKIASLYCGAPSFCHEPMNVQTCRDIWADKVNRNCSDWADWLSSSNHY